MIKQPTQYQVIQKKCLIRNPNPNETQLQREFALGEFSASIHINSIGLRDDEPRTDSTLHKILGLGDSFTFGHGVEAESSFIEILENKLNRVSPTDILNAGVPGTGPDHYLKVFNHVNKVYKANHVLFCIFIGNDLNDLKLNTKGKKPKEASSSKADNSGSSFKTFLRKNIHLYSFCSRSGENDSVGSRISC